MNGVEASFLHAIPKDKSLSAPAVPGQSAGQSQSRCPGIAIDENVLNFYLGRRMDCRKDQWAWQGYKRRKSRLLPNKAR